MIFIAKYSTNDWVWIARNDFLYKADNIIERYWVQVTDYPSAYNYDNQDNIETKNQSTSDTIVEYFKISNEGEINTIE